MKRRLKSGLLTMKKSPPTRGRGLKRGRDSVRRQIDCVAPHAGAWIETFISIVIGFILFLVAPHAGAWIETLNPQIHFLPVIKSPPTRGRGLKHISD